MKILNKFFFLILLGLTSSVVAKEKPFVVGGILGQLGNRLFQVASTSALAWDHGAEPLFPDFEPLRAQPDFLHIFFRCNTKAPWKPIAFETGVPPFGYHPIPYRENMKISGYFQNEKYFAHQREKILQLFAPLPKDLKEVKKKYGKYLNHPETVSVHLRYYFREKPDEDAFIQYDYEYFEKAMALFPETSLFIVTSDNIEFARQNISTAGRNVVFIENEPFYIDFLIQRLCKHNIISNSSFSWWSAWLNENPNKIVVRPKVWLGGYEDIGGPDNWIKIEADGMQAKLKRKSI